MSISNSPDLGNQTSPIEELTYEQAFGELEEIVVALEQNNPSLETTMALFERAQALARRCSNLLDQAELKVQQISGEGLVDFTPESS